MKLMFGVTIVVKMRKNIENTHTLPEWKTLQNFSLEYTFAALSLSLSAQRQILLPNNKENACALSLFHANAHTHSVQNVANNNNNNFAATAMKTTISTE